MGFRVEAVWGLRFRVKGAVFRVQGGPVLDDEGEGLFAELARHGRQVDGRDKRRERLLEYLRWGSASPQDTRVIF